MQGVVNYGSALQAYALQEYLVRNGHDAEIINYKFYNSYHQKRIKRSLYEKFRYKLAMFLTAVLPNRVRKRKRFETFWKKYFHLSSFYKDRDAIFSNPPKYDIYMTGSDQTWNIEGICYDTTFFCGFAPKGSKKVAFAASFSKNELPIGSEKFVYENLKDYSFIGCRERSSLKILQSLHLKESKILNTCDPSLLLSAEDYSPLANDSKLKLPEKYVLVYYMGYAFPPEPAFSKVLIKVEERYKCKVLILGGKRFAKHGNHIHIDGIGPCEFIDLYKNAQYVVTSSFHGTMFSLIFKKPFTSIVAPSWHSDHRLSDLPNVIGFNNNFINGDEENPNPEFNNPYSEVNQKQLEDFILASKAFLIESINN